MVSYDVKVTCPDSASHGHVTHLHEVCFVIVSGKTTMINKVFPTNNYFNIYKQVALWKLAY